MMDRFSFIGAGNMAYAIICGMGSEGVTVYDKNPAQYEKFQGKVSVAQSIPEAVKSADYIVLSVKPQNFKEVLTEIRESAEDLNGKTFISIAAGVKISSICKTLGQDVAVIRTMPNTPLLIGKGVTAVSCNRLVTKEAFDKVKGVFEKTGMAFELPESEMNSVISATSSAPAYIYFFIDSIYKEAVKQGLENPQMLKAICEMVKGSADMVLSSGKTPEELIKMVTSPNGTTEKAMQVLYGDGVDRSISKAMEACTKRAEELSGELD